MEIVPRKGWQARMAELEARLAEFGLPLREDSRLCVRYVMLGTGNAFKIANAMNEMEFFWRRTGYRRALRVIEREHWPNELDRDLLSSLAKRRALRWLVRAGDENTLHEAPQSLADEIELARMIVAEHPPDE